MWTQQQQRPLLTPNSGRDPLAAVGTLCGTRRDSRPYSVRFIRDVCNTVH